MKSHKECIMFKVEAGKMVGPCQDDKSQRKPRFLSASAEGRSTHTATVTLPFSLRSPNGEPTDGPFPRVRTEEQRVGPGARAMGPGSHGEVSMRLRGTPQFKQRRKPALWPPWMSCTPAGFMELGWSQEGRWESLQKEHQATVCL